MRSCHKKCIIASADDFLLVDVNTGREIDIDAKYGIGGIRGVTVNDHRFFILANKLDGVLGKYLMSIDPSDMDNLDYRQMVSMETWLDIADANLFLVKSVIGSNKAEWSPVQEIDKDPRALVDANSINFIVMLFKTVYANNF